MKTRRYVQLLTALALSLAAAGQTVTRGPYLQSGTPSRVIVKWRTDSASDSVVRYGFAPGNLTQAASVPGAVTNHEVVVVGLPSNTTYYYSVGTFGQELAGNDDSHYFVTSPPAGTAKPTRIWVIGDSGTANTNAAAVRDAFVTYTGSRHADLWMMLGDNAYPDGTDAQYQAAVFNMYPLFLRNTVLWPTLGNHDGHTADSASQTGPYYDIFTLPKFGEAGGVPSGTEAYYSFDYGNIHFVCLDSYETSRSPSGAMLTWLEADLLANNEPWVIGFWHHPPYTKGSHNSDTETELIDMRENALPLLEQYGVDLVLTGHSHSYERSYLIDGHYGLSSTFIDSMKVDGGDGRETGSGAYEKPVLERVPHAGAVYAVAGSSGQTSGGALNHPVMFLALNALGSMVLDINGDRLDAVFLDSAGAVRDEFTMLKGTDATAPQISAVEAKGDPTHVSVTYSEGVEKNSAEAASNYHIDHGVTVTGAVLEPDAKTASLTTTTLAKGVTYTLTVNNVTDLSGNVIAPDTQAQFEYREQATVDFQDGRLPDGGYGGTRDTYIAEATPTANFGAASQLLVDGDDPSGTGKDLATLIRWDISQIPPGSAVEEVEITFEVFNVSGSTYEVYELKRDWVEVEATWDQAANGSQWNTPGAKGAMDRGSTELGALAASAMGPAKVLLNADGLAAVQNWVDNPAANFGLVLANSSAGDGADMRSREYGTVTGRPSLRVTYSPPGGGPPEPRIHVQEIGMELKNAGKWRYARATVRITDEAGSPVEAATVSVQWSGLTSDADSVTTNASGDAVVDSDKVTKSATGQFSVTITGVAKAGAVYDQAANTESADCIDTGGNACGGPPGSGELHVSTVEVTLSRKGRDWSGRATVALLDQDGNPVSSALVEGRWTLNGTDIGGASGTTDGSGQAVVNSPKERASTGDVFRYTVTDVSLSGYTLDPASEGSCGEAVVP